MSKTTTSWSMAAELAHKAELEAVAGRWEAEQARNVARVERAVARLQLDVQPTVYALPQGQVRAVMPPQTDVTDELGLVHDVALVTSHGTSQLQVQVRAAEVGQVLTHRDPSTGEQTMTDGRPAGPWLDYGPLGTLADLGAALVCDLEELTRPAGREPSTAELLHHVLEALVRDVVLDVTGGTA